jgi:ABC-type phosphate transport system substrate-binding protein
VKAVTTFLDAFPQGLCNAWLPAFLLCSLAMLPQARADVVVIVSAKSSTGTMNAEQVAAIFLGKSRQLEPLDNGDKGAVHDEFYTKLTGKNDAQVKAIWSKLIFTGRGTPPKMLSSSSEVVKAVAADPNAISYVEKSAVDSSVKVILEAK